MQAKVSRLNSVLHGDRVEHKRSRGWHHSMGSFCGLAPDSTLILSIEH